jgi:hypothetical protein
MPKTPEPQAKAEVDAKAAAQAKADAHPSLPVARTPVAAMPTLDKAIVTDKPAAPGPKITAVTPGGTAAGATLPVLAPRAGAAPPILRDEKAPATPARSGPADANAPKPAHATPHDAPSSKPDVRPDAKTEAKPAPPPAATAPAAPAAPSTHPTPAVSEAKPVDSKKKLEGDKAMDEKK